MDLRKVLVCTDGVTGFPCIRLAISIETWAVHKLYVEKQKENHAVWLFTRGLHRQCEKGRAH